MSNKNILVGCYAAISFLILFLCFFCLHEVVLRMISPQLISFWSQKKLDASQQQKSIIRAKYGLLWKNNSIAVNPSFDHSFLSSLIF